MNQHQAENDIDFSEFDLEDRETAARRLLTYSDKALGIALPIDQLFVNHPAFAAALAGLDRIFQLATKVDMSHGMRLIGPSGTGKTSLLMYFQRSLPQSSLFSTGLGAIYVRVPKRVTAPYLIGALLRQFGYSHSRVTKDSLELRTSILLEAIRQKGTRMIMFDEAHNLANGTTKGRRTREEGTSPTDLIRQLMDGAKVGVVFSGVSTLDEISELDEALASRVVGRFELQLFAYNTAWIRLIKALVQQVLQFDISILMTPEVSQKLHKVTQGSLRGLKRLMTETVLVAVDAGAGKVELCHLEKAYGVVYGANCQTGNPFEPVAA